MNKNISVLRYLKIRNIRDRIRYQRWANFIEKSQWWNRDEFDRYQWEKVSGLLEHSYRHVPYYTEVFRSIGAKPEDFKSWEDFYKFPFLTKDIVRERATDLISALANTSKLQYYTTGGSTGVPLGLYKRRGSVVSRAFMDQQWKRVGYSEKSKRVILRGEPVQNGKIYKKYPFSNDWVLSSYNLSENTIQKYVDFLNKIKPEFLHVYPSSLYIFSRLLENSGLTLSFSPKAILCGSEPVRQYQRELFEKTFGSRVYSWLGMSEGVIMAGECEYSSIYHSWPQLSHVEILSENNIHVQALGEMGEIVGTSLHNYTFPFIRYKTADKAEFHGIGCDKCKRHFLLLSKIDRWQQEVIVSKNGVYVSATGLNPHSEIFNNVIQFQFIQKIPGEIILLLVRKEAYSQIDTEKIINEFRSKLSDEFEIKIEFADFIPRTSSGKHRYLRQELDLQLINNPEEPIN